MGGIGAFVRRKWGRGWEETSCLSEGNRAEDGRERIVCTKETERKMGGIGAFVRRKWGRGWEVTERLFSAVGEKSIDFLKILYRLFRKTL